MKFEMNKKLTYKVVNTLIVLCLLHSVLIGQVASSNQSSSKPVDAFAQEAVFVHTDKPYYLTGETLWFKAYCTDYVTGSLSPLSAVVYVELFDQENQPVAQLKVPLNSGTASGQIFISSSWSTGNYLLRAYTAWMRNSDEANFYHQPVALINPLSVLSPSNYRHDSIAAITPEFVVPNQGKQIEISTDHKIYGNRQSVLINLLPTTAEQGHLDLSVAVYPYHPSLESGVNIRSSLETLSPLSNNLESPNTIKYFPETVGPIIYGDLRNSMLAEDDLMLSLRGEAARIYSPITLDSNRFALQITKEVDYDHVYFWSLDHKDIPVTIDAAFDQRTNAGSSLPLTFAPATIEFIEDQSVNTQISNLYKEYTYVHGAPTLPNEQAVPFYGPPEYQYNLDDYTRFPELEEVFREFVRYVSLRKLSGVMQLFVWDHYSNHQSIANNIFFDQPALILLDGIPVGNLDLLMEVDPLRIQTIEVVTKKYNVGNQIFYGVVNLKSYKEDFTGDEALFGVKKISYSSLHKPLGFFHPNHGSTSNKRIPDRRNTLYWDPDVSIISAEPEQLRFYTGDGTGDYQIVVNGVTATGQLIYQTKVFTVLGREMP